ncbi:unnamed protein product, partial [Ceratitis capitata]
VINQPWCWPPLARKVSRTPLSSRAIHMQLYNAAVVSTYLQHQYQQHSHHNNNAANYKQQQQSNNINMLDFSGRSYVEPMESDEQQLESSAYPPPTFDFVCQEI